MMIGPEPITRTLRISAAGKGFAGWRADHGHPLLEQIGGIERPGAAFGMVLDRHDRKMPVPQSLHGAVVEVAVGDDDLPLRAERRFVHGVAVVLGGYAHAAPLQIAQKSGTATRGPGPGWCRGSGAETWPTRSSVPISGSARARAMRSASETSSVEMTPRWRPWVRRCRTRRRVSTPPIPTTFHWTRNALRLVSDRQWWGRPAASLTMNPSACGR